MFTKHACTKRIYNSRSEAQAGIMKLCRYVADDPDHFLVYPCSGCSGFHFGHKPEYRRTRLYPALKPKPQYAYA